MISFNRKQEGSLQHPWINKCAAGLTFVLGVGGDEFALGVDVDQLHVSQAHPLPVLTERPEEGGGCRCTPMHKHPRVYNTKHPH